MTTLNPTITITGEELLNHFFKYIGDNQKAPKNEQTTAYKELEEICKNNNITMDELVDYIKEINGVW